MSRSTVRVQDVDWAATAMEIAGDLLIVTTPSIAKEAVVARVENMTYRGGIVVDYPNLWVSGHAIQLMWINLLQPKYLFPIQVSTAAWTFDAAAMEVGMPPENNLHSLSVQREYDHGDFVPAGAASAGEACHD